MGGRGGGSPGGTREQHIEADILAAYNQLKGRTDLPHSGINVGNPEMGMPFTDLLTLMRRNGNVFLADLREALSTRWSRAEVDKALTDLMIRNPRVHLQPMHAQAILTNRDRSARLHIGGGTVDYITIE